MSNKEKEKNVYRTDEMYLPIEYKGILIKKPVFNGNGNHTINDLEKICNQFQEYCHQQQIIKQNCMNHIVELKFETI